MRTIISEDLYKVALKRVEELLPLVNENTPDDEPEMTELSHFSDIIEAYEKERFPIESPSFASVIEERLREEGMQKKTLAKKIGVSASRISDFLSGKSEPSLSQAREICRALNITPGIALQL